MLLVPFCDTGCHLGLSMGTKTPDASALAFLSCGIVTMGYRLVWYLVFFGGWLEGMVCLLDWFMIS